MLDDLDLEWLVGQLAATSELLGQELKPNAAALLAADLSVYDRGTLDAALRRVRTEHTGKLTPKAIMDRIDELAGRPAANEAWALALQALDERATVVWTGEMSDAWAVARGLAAAGDLVGARMAFISTYERLVRVARDMRQLPDVHVSVGWDAGQRDVALEKAVQIGMLPAAVASRYRQPSLPAPALNAVALLAGRVEATAEAPPDVRERLARLRDEIAARAGRSTRRAMAKARLTRMQQSKRKEQINEEVRKRLMESA